MENSPCILIVDDVEINVTLISCFFKKLPYTILTANSGEEVFDILANKRVDVILLDLIMPGMDGYEVLRRIRSNAATSAIPVIVLSALNMHEDIDKAMDMGANEYINKPLVMSKVVDAVKKYI